MIVLSLFLIRYGTHQVASPAVLPEQPNSQIVWLSEPGPGGGGGGGGNQMKEPPRQAQEARQGQDDRPGREAAGNEAAEGNQGRDKAPD